MSLQKKIYYFAMVKWVPIAQLDGFCRYETNITEFLVVPKPVVESRYLNAE
jgi:hypothetical protein